MKNVLFILVAFGIFTSSYSQTKKSFGIRGGINLSNLSNANLDQKTSGYFSVFGHFRFSDLYALQPEIGYSNQGGRARNISNIDDIEIHYISISAINKFFVKDSGFHFLIGPGFDFDVDDTVIGISNRDEGNDVTFIDLTINLGIGLEFKNGLGFEARYKQGLIDVFSGTWHDFESEQYQDEIQFNGVFQLGLFYKFNF
ncbi:porin family protein [Flavivirga amylovorans]|uniref:Porin family protein n=1 Tax=Flavivirga amylovorans TaxID=870486 RepID=A0ABT8WZM5_9FLAO|nr:porin family protein [Flavivirga amylovorans]MDO5986947.1 porin family protein [Flavivirga amylovorans]